MRILQRLSILCTAARRSQCSTRINVKMPTIVKLSHPANQSQVESACDSLLNGQIIAVPTDTIYGIAGLAQNTDAVNRMYNIKKRDVNNPIAISVATIDDIYKWSKVTVPRDLLSNLLPGPVTVVMERSDDLNHNFNPGTSLIGIRIPNHQFIIDIASTCDGPIALTSANISATRSTLCVEEFKNLWPQLDLICDGGQLGVTDSSRGGSTVVDLSVSGTYRIIRDGSARPNTEKLLQKYGLTERT